jgi:hypothetical protein
LQIALIQMRRIAAQFPAGAIAFDRAIGLGAAAAAAAAVGLPPASTLTLHVNILLSGPPHRRRARYCLEPHRAPAHGRSAAAMTREAILFPVPDTFSGRVSTCSGPQLLHHIGSESWRQARLAAPDHQQTLRRLPHQGGLSGLSPAAPRFPSWTILSVFPADAQADLSGPKLI